MGSAGRAGPGTSRRGGTGAVPVGRGRSATGTLRRGRSRSAAARRGGVAVRAVQVPELTPTVGPRGQDRVLLVAGVVLGAAGFAVVRVLDRAVRTTASALRPRRDPQE